MHLDFAEPHATITTIRTRRATTTRRASTRRSERRDDALMDLFTYGFMQRALIAAVVTGLAAPSVGTYLVQRRLAVDGRRHRPRGRHRRRARTRHRRFPHLDRGRGRDPRRAIELIRERGHNNGDVALALLFYGGLAGGVLLTGIGGRAARLQSYLFGSITTISATDVLVTMALAAVVVVVCVGLRRSCSRSPRTRSSPGWPGCASARTTC